MINENVKADILRVLTGRGLTVAEMYDALPDYRVGDCEIDIVLQEMYETDGTVCQGGFRQNKWSGKDGHLVWHRTGERSRV